MYFFLSPIIYWFFYFNRNTESREFKLLKCKGNILSSSGFLFFVLIIFGIPFLSQSFIILSGAIIFLNVCFIYSSGLDIWKEAEGKIKKKIKKDTFFYKAAFSNILDEAVKGKLDEILDAVEVEKQERKRKEERSRGHYEQEQEQEQRKSSSDNRYQEKDFTEINNSTLIIQSILKEFNLPIDTTDFNVIKKNTENLLNYIILIWRTEMLGNLRKYKKIMIF